MFKPFDEKSIEVERVSARVSWEPGIAFNSIYKITFSVYFVRLL